MSDSNSRRQFTEPKLVISNPVSNQEPLNNAFVSVMGGRCCMCAQLVEIVMDLGRPPLARFPSGDLRLADDVISNADLAHAISKVPCRPAARMQMAPPYFTPAHKLEKYHLLC